MSYASAGVGSSPHVANELLNSLAQIKIVHVPYKGSPQALLGVINGEADMTILSITSIRPLLEVGKVRALVVTSAKRTALMPSMPTLHESGVPGYARTGWYGLLGLAGMPKEIVSKLNATLVQLMNTPEMKATYFKYGLEPETNSPDEFTALIHREIEQNIKLARGAGIKLE